MDDDPYRAGAKLDGKLEKLAAEGRHRIADAAASDAAAQQSAQERNRDRNMRAALGGYYGTPLRTFLSVLLVVCIVSSLGLVATALLQASLEPHSPLAVAVGSTLALAWLFTIPLVAFPFVLLLRLLVPPLASPARVALERQWVRSLPIGLDDTYFEVLAADPTSECRLELEIEGQDALPALDVIQGVVGVMDTKARVVSSSRNVVRVVSGPISGRTGVSVSSSGGPPSSVLRNNRIVAYVHDFVGKVLLPLHESSAIARVTFSRDR